MGGLASWLGLRVCGRRVLDANREEISCTRSEIRFLAEPQFGDCKANETWRSPAGILLWRDESDCRTNTARCSCRAAAVRVDLQMSWAFVREAILRCLASSLLAATDVAVTSQKVQVGQV